MLNLLFDFLANLEAMLQVSGGLLHSFDHKAAQGRCYRSPHNLQDRGHSNDLHPPGHQGAASRRTEISQDVPGHRPVFQLLLLLQLRPDPFPTVQPQQPCLPPTELFGPTYKVSTTLTPSNRTLWTNL